MTIPKSVKRRSRFSEDFRWALGWTLFVATLFSAYVVVVSIARLSTWFEPYHLSTWTIIAAYYVAAMAAALALAILRPLGTSRAGSYVLGVVIGFLVYGFLGVVSDGFSHVTLWTALIASLCMGGLGIVIHDSRAAGWEGAWTMPGKRMIVYVAVLLLSALLLWLDIRYHIINK